MKERTAAARELAPPREAVGGLYTMVLVFVISKCTNDSHLPGASGSGAWAWNYFGESVRYLELCGVVGWQLPDSARMELVS